MLTGVWKEETGIWFGSRNKNHVIPSAYQTQSKACFPSLPPPQLGRNPCPLTLLHMGKEHLKRLNALQQVCAQVP